MPVARKSVLTGGNVSRNPIQAKQMYVLTEKGDLRLVWDLVLYSHDRQHWWNLSVDAITGHILDQSDWMKNAINCLYQLRLQWQLCGQRTIFKLGRCPICDRAIIVTFCQ